MKDNRLISLQ